MCNPFNEECIVAVIFGFVESSKMFRVNILNRITYSISKDHCVSPSIGMVWNAVRIIIYVHVIDIVFPLEHVHSNL